MSAGSSAGKHSPLSYRAFRLLWLSSIVSYVGTFVQNVGEAWLMMDLTKSPLPVAMLSTAFVGASLFAVLPAGILADRYSRRRVANASQLVQATAATGMAVLSFTGHITPAALVVGVALLGLGMALGSPAWAALLPELVPPEMVAEAVALNSVAFNLARAVGPAIGGVVVARFGATTSFALNAASFVVVTTTLSIYRSERTTIPPPPSPIPLTSAFAEPWRLASSADELRPVFLSMFAFTLGAGMFYALTPAFGKLTLGSTPLAYGVMIGAMGAGAVAGASVMKRLRGRISPRVLVTAAMLVFATSIAIVSRVSSVAFAMVLLVPAGAGWLGAFSSVQALVQVWSPHHLRARVMSLYQMVHLATWAVASALGGYLADHLGVRAAMGAGAAVCVVAALSTWRHGLPRSFSGNLGTV
jgi:MFS family permease